MTTKKVQAEADRLLKKVNEGLEGYDELYEKLGNAPNASAKERLEGDLKRELKKLQRHREAMKTFLQNDDYKEKTKMQATRKKIEERMEGFRAIEREMKTKAFSNEGLASAANDRSESSTEKWLKEAIKEGQKRIELLDCEVENADSGRYRRTKSKAMRETEQRLSMLYSHTSQWETLLRMVSNEEVDTEEVDELQYIIQDILKEDADIDLLLDLSIYDSFDTYDRWPKQRDADDKLLKGKGKPLTPASATQTKAKASPSTSAKEAVAKTTSAAKMTPGSGATVATTTGSSLSPVSGGRLSPATGGTTPGKAMDAATAAEEEEEESVPEWMDDDMDAVNDDTFGADVGSPGGVVVGSLADMASATSKLTKEWDKMRASTEIKSAAPNTTSGAAVASPSAAKELTVAEVEERLSAPRSTQPNVWEQRAAEQSRLQQQQLRQQQPQAPSQPQPPQPQQQPLQQPPPTIPTTVVTAATPEAAETVDTGSPNSAKKIASPRIRGTRFSASTINSLFNSSLANLPHTLDVERQRAYEPPNAIEPIPYFPQEVLPVLADKTVYHQMDLDTLFFIFYYHQKSYQQYFAAKELKTRSYRYHTEQRRWYQRVERPQEANGLEERGSYTFFDFEDKWVHDRVDDFRFEYKYLESDLV